MDFTEKSTATSDLKITRTVHVILEVENAKKAAQKIEQNVIDLEGTPKVLSRKRMSQMARNIRNVI